MAEMSSLRKDLCAKNFGSQVVLNSLPAGTSFPTQRKEKFQVHVLCQPQYSVKFQQSLSSAGDVRRVDNLRGFQGLNAQLPYLAEGCDCKLLHSPLWTFIFVV